MKKHDEDKMIIPKAGAVYRHFKGSLYEVVTIAVHTETSEKLVVYRSVENNARVFARPLDMFLSKVDHIKYPFVKAKYRFEPADENEKIDENEEPELKDTEEESIEDDSIAETNDIQNQEETEQEEESYLDPVLEKLLDAKDYSEKLEYLELLRQNCDANMLSIIAVSHDIELTDGSVEEKFAQILKHFKMHEKYETTRLRT